MKYVGSKRTLAKELLPIVLANRSPEQAYVEPFCGGCNMLDKVSGKRIANDSHSELIAFWKALQEGWIPPLQVLEEEYTSLKTDKEAPAYLRGYVGFNLSFGAKYWGGYARYTSPEGKKQDFAREAYNFVMKQKPLLKDVEFLNLDYKELLFRLPENSIIYCDPPYKDSLKYSTGLDYEEFYTFCRDAFYAGHQVFVSEYWMPEDFICVWEKAKKVQLTNLTPCQNRTEKLFVL